ncbi:MAG: DUF3617 domain-containing protein, partial [Thermodesulfobacteriota bacterium]
LALSDASLAGSDLIITPGMYHITSSTKSNYDTKPMERSIDRCIMSSNLDPETVLPDKDDCKIENVVKSGVNARFDFSCNDRQTGRKLTGHAEYSTQGTSFNYKFKIDSPFNDKHLQLDSQGTAKRTGDCTLTG